MLDLTDRIYCFYWQTDRKLSGEDYVRIFLRRHETSSDEITKILLEGITSIKHISGIKIHEPDPNVLKGNVNIVRKVEMNGRLYIVRMHPKGVKNGYFYAEKTALDLCIKENLPVPQVLEIHEARDENDMDFMLLTVSSGINMDIYLNEHKDREEDLLVDAGKQMAALHNIRVRNFGFFDNQIAKEKYMLVGLHKRYNDFIWTGLEENLQRLITLNVLQKPQADSMKKVFEVMDFEPVDSPRLIHNDFADWNLLTDGKRITGILDWDECHSGDPVADIACWSTFYSLERLEKFIEGYKKIMKLPKDYNTRFHFYRLRYTISKMALRCKRYQVDKSDFIREKIEVGKQALTEETKWFNL